MGYSFLKTLPCTEQQDAWSLETHCWCITESSWSIIHRIYHSVVENLINCSQWMEVQSGMTEKMWSNYYKSSVLNFITLGGKLICFPKRDWKWIILTVDVGRRKKRMEKKERWKSTMHFYLPLSFMEWLRVTPKWTLWLYNVTHCRLKITVNYSHPAFSCNLHYFKTYLLNQYLNTSKAAQFFIFFACSL